MLNVPGPASSNRNASTLFNADSESGASDIASISFDKRSEVNIFSLSISCQNNFTDLSLEASNYHYVLIIYNGITFKLYLLVSTLPALRFVLLSMEIC